RLLGADRIAVFADVHVKHAVPLVGRPIRESALDLIERGLADAVVVSGSRTGQAPKKEDLEAVRGLGEVVIGSGLTAQNVGDLFPRADGAIVATTFREGGNLARRVDPARVKEFMEEVRRIRAGGTGPDDPGPRPQLSR